MNDDYSFSVASFEIIIALSAAFIIGALLCYLLRLIGRLFRGKPAAETTAHYGQPHAQSAYPDDRMTPVVEGEHQGYSEPERNVAGGFQAAFPQTRAAQPVTERAPISQREPTPVNRLVEGGSTYEADIDTLLRRGGGSQHAVSLPQNGRNHDMDASFASRARESLTPSTANTYTHHTPPARDPVVAQSNDLPTPAEDQIDDLKKLEGIGPNIEKLLNQYEIHSYARLATLSRDQLKDVLAAGGNEYKMHDPKSWPYQAELAAKQNWERLREYQEFLIEGRNR